MSENQVSDILAQAIAAEGVDTVFTLMGSRGLGLARNFIRSVEKTAITAVHTAAV